MDPGQDLGAGFTFQGWLLLVLLHVTSFRHNKWSGPYLYCCVTIVSEFHRFSDSVRHMERKSNMPRKMRHSPHQPNVATSPSQYMNCEEIGSVAKVFALALRLWCYDRMWQSGSHSSAHNKHTCSCGHHSKVWRMQASLVTKGLQQLLYRGKLSIGVNFHIIEHIQIVQKLDPTKSFAQNHKITWFFLAQ